MLLKYFESIFLRLLPGAINVGALLLVGTLLTPTEYGQFSLAVAATGFIAVLLFGPLYLGAIAQHAHLTAAGHRSAYESSYVSAVVLIATLSAIVGLLAHFMGIAPGAWVAVTVAVGAYSSILELLRARLQIWRYGAASSVQSLSYIILIYFLLAHDAEYTDALILFAESYGIAAIAALVMLRPANIRLVSISFLRDTLRLGAGSVLSNIAEQGLYIGMRYVILLFGTPGLLGVFSFCVDLAQRTVGFLINAASFVLIPLAFNSSAKGSVEQFGITLRAAARNATMLSLLAFVAILIVRETRYVPALNGALFDVATFAMVCVAVVLNRLKKLVVDPFAMRARLPQMLSVGYIAGFPIALTGSAVAYRANLPELGPVAYAAGYLIALVVTILALRRRGIALSVG